MGTTAALLQDTAWHPLSLFGMLAGLCPQAKKRCEQAKRSAASCLAVAVAMRCSLPHALLSCTAYHAGQADEAQASNVLRSVLDELTAAGTPALAVSRAAAAKSQRTALSVSQQPCQSR